MVRKYTDKQLLDRVKSLKTYTKIPQKLWILGVRSKADIENAFDDKFYVFEGEKFIQVLTGTTHAGRTILKGGFKKYNAAGAAIVKADEWYYNVWRFGMHKGKVQALLQVGAPVKVFRDGDMDGKAEELGQYTQGWFGINFHPNTYDLGSPVQKEHIESWSAGCQVVNEVAKYRVLMARFAAQSTESVSFCLINEFDLL